MEFYDDKEKEKYYEDLLINTTNKHNNKIENFNQLVSDCDKTLESLKNDRYVQQYIELLNIDSVLRYIHVLGIKQDYIKRIEEENNDYRRNICYCCNHNSALLIEKKRTINKCYCLKCQSEQLLEDSKAIIDINRVPDENDIRNIQDFYNNLIKDNFCVDEINSKIANTFTSSNEKVLYKEKASF